MSLVLSKNYSITLEALIMNDAPLLRVCNLQVSYPSRHGRFDAVKGVSFELYAGEILGIVGESGAGKSTIGNAITGLLTPPGYVAGGEAIFLDKNLTKLSEQALSELRGKEIGFIFQDPMTSLNPLLTIGEQLIEPMLLYLSLSLSAAKQRAIELLTAVGIREPELRMRQYPHQFSGGMRQRVVIAIALSTEPKFIIADEPTTALDVSIQDQILQLLKRLCREQNVGCILVTHDMGVVASVTDRVMVTYRGEMMEIGTTAQVLRNPSHDYTKSLIAAVPPSTHKISRFPLVNYIEAGAIAHTPLDLTTHWLGQAAPHKSAYQGAMLQVEQLSLRFCTHHSLFAHKRRYVQAVDAVSFSIDKGESFGLVGESGSGKSTIARLLTGLYRPDSGKIYFEGVELGALDKGKSQLAHRCAMQMVFQNPYSSLNPRMKVKEIIAEPMIFHGLADKRQAQTVTSDLIDYVGLAKNAGEKYPHEFSGGQRQRISIARALASRPRLLICDEPTSALDVSVQAQILNLLKDLQEELQLTMLFISHDLPVIRQMCDRIAVMKFGKLLEMGSSEQIFEQAGHEYTRELIGLMPRFEKIGSAG